MFMTFYLLIGIPGSGKSTYAKKLSKETNAIIISSDDIRTRLFGSRQNISNDRVVFKTMRKEITENLNEGKNVICDATNVTISKRASFLNELINIDCKKIAIVINRDTKTCIEQNKLRDKTCQVPAVAIYTSAKKFEYPTLSEGFDEIMEV